MGGTSRRRYDAARHASMRSSLRLKLLGKGFADVMIVDLDDGGKV
jgi:hypothetical protein